MDVSKSITYHVTKTGNLLRRLTAKKIRDAGIDVTPEESAVLNQLWDKDNQSVSELAQWAVKEPSTLSRQIDGLARKGYVTRQRSDADRRSLHIKLTARGKSLESKFEATGIRQLDHDLLTGLPGTPKATLQILIDLHEAARRELGE